jgi:surfactin synthase thioesterase subunit
VFAGYSFGTILAFETVRLLEKNITFKCGHLISFAGLHQAFLATLTLFKEICKDEEFEQKVMITVLGMYKKIPEFMNEDSDPTFRKHLLEGTYANITFQF